MNSNEKLMNFMHFYNSYTCNDDHLIFLAMLTKKNGVFLTKYHFLNFHPFFSIKNRGQETFVGERQNGVRF